MQCTQLYQPVLWVLRGCEWCTGAQTVSTHKHDLGTWSLFTSQKWSFQYFIRMSCIC